MLSRANNHSFVDGPNLHKSLDRNGLRIDLARFRTYLREKLGVSVAYYFIGYVPGREDLYRDLESAGYVVVLKPTLLLPDGGVKGNCDTELVLKAATTVSDYEQAVLVTNDGDFSCLVQYLKARGQFRNLVASSRNDCSRLLRVAAGHCVIYVDEVPDKVGLKRK
jgi:uncharacterized LabA/DUF88 family protein